MAIVEHPQTASDDASRSDRSAEGNSYRAITDRVCAITERPQPTRAWTIAFAVSSSLTLMLFALIGYLITQGVGV